MAPPVSGDSSNREDYCLVKVTNVKCIALSGSYFSLVLLESLPSLGLTSIPFSLRYFYFVFGLSYPASVHIYRHDFIVLERIARLRATPCSM